MAPARGVEPHRRVHEVRNDFVAPHYVRFTVADRPGILAPVFAVFARHDINVEGVVQLPRFRQGSAAVRRDARGVFLVGAQPRPDRDRAEPIST